MNVVSCIDPHDEEQLSEQREGHGHVLLTIQRQILFIDSRARKLCQELQEAEGRTLEGILPLSLVKLCGEITDALQWRSHSKDWERFAMKRVAGGAKRQIFIWGVGLPAGIVNQDAGILLTLDYIGARARLRPHEGQQRFGLTDREVMVVQGLLKGWTNKEIANELRISEQTVKEHLKHIMDKTNTHTRTGVLVKLNRNA